MFFLIIGCNFCVSNIELLWLIVWLVVFCKFFWFLDLMFVFGIIMGFLVFLFSGGDFIDMIFMILFCKCFWYFIGFVSLFCVFLGGCCIVWFWILLNMLIENNLCGCEIFEIILLFCLVGFLFLLIEKIFKLLLFGKEIYLLFFFELNGFLDLVLVLINFIFFGIL